MIIFLNIKCSIIKLLESAYYNPASVDHTIVRSGAHNSLLAHWIPYISELYDEISTR